MLEGIDEALGRIKQTFAYTAYLACPLREGLRFEDYLKLTAVADKLRDPGVCCASHIEAQSCEPNQTARWAGRELNRILGRTGPSGKESGR